jgi:hypothetical protein
MTACCAPVILITDEHVLSATIPTSGQRVLDILNDPRSQFLTVQNASVLRRRDGSRIATLPDAVMRKANIGAALLSGGEHEAPEKRRSCYLRKDEHVAFLVVLGYEVTGTMHLNASKDAVTVLYHEAGAFTPVANAVVSFAGAAPRGQAVDVALVNQSLISLIHVGDPHADELSLPGVEKAAVPNPA